MYRSDEGAAEARRVQIEHELEELEPRVDELAYLKWKQKELADELAAATARKADFARARTGVRVAPVVVSQREIWAQRFAIVSAGGLLMFAFWIVTGIAEDSLSGGPRSTSFVVTKPAPADGMQDRSRWRALPSYPTPHMGRASGSR